jgi:hypothetical protein
MLSSTHYQSRMAHKILLNRALLGQNCTRGLYCIHVGLWLDLVATPMPRAAATLTRRGPNTTKV